MKGGITHRMHGVRRVLWTAAALDRVNYHITHPILPFSRRTSTGHWIYRILTDWHQSAGLILKSRSAFK